MYELEGDTWHEGMVPCSTRGEDTWHMSGSQVSYSQLLHGMGGWIKGMENTWPSNGHVSKLVGGGYPTSKLFLFEKRRRKRKRERKKKYREKGKEREGGSCAVFSSE